MASQKVTRAMRSKRLTIYADAQSRGETTLRRVWKLRSGLAIEQPSQQPATVYGGLDRRTCR